MGIWPWKKKASQDRWEFLTAEIAYMRPLLAGYPPTCTNLNEVGRRWERAITIANEYLGETANSIDARWAFGELLRMGHNMDAHKTSPFARGFLKQAPRNWRAENLADVALPLLMQLVDDAPGDFRGLLSMAELTLAAFEGGAEKTEEFYHRAAKLAPPVFQSDISQGLAHACLKQGKTSEAITHLERCVAEGNQRPRVLELLGLLKAGKEPKTIFRKE